MGRIVPADLEHIAAAARARILAARTNERGEGDIPGSTQGERGGVSSARGGGTMWADWFPLILFAAVFVVFLLRGGSGGG